MNSNFINVKIVILLINFLIMTSSSIEIFKKYIKSEFHNNMYLFTHILVLLSNLKPISLIAFCRHSNKEAMKKHHKTIGISYGVKKMDWIKYIKKDFYLTNELIILETTMKCVKKIISLKILKNIKKHFKNNPRINKPNSSIYTKFRYNFFPQTFLLPS